MSVVLRQDQRRYRYGLSWYQRLYRDPPPPLRAVEQSNMFQISLEQWAWFGRQNYGTLKYDVSFNYQSL